MTTRTECYVWRRWLQVQHFSCKFNMIVQGSPPPYRHLPRTMRNSSSCSLVPKPSAIINRSDSTSLGKIAERQRPKSSPLRCEKKMKNLNVKQTGSKSMLMGSKPKKNWKSMEGTFGSKGIKFTVVQPGYLMTKRKSGINVTLNMDELCAGASKDKRKARDMLIKSLQQEIDDLNRTLAEERFSSRSQFREFVENTNIEIKVMQQEHRDHIKTIEEEHAEEIEKLTDLFQAKMTDSKAEADLRAACMQKEMDSVRETLQTCKNEVASEMEGKWVKEKKNLELESQLRTEELLAKQKLQLKKEKIIEINNVKLDHELAIDKLNEHYDKEMRTLLEKFAVCAADAENLKVALFEAEKLKEEVEELRDIFARTMEKLRKTQNELADAKVKLQGYELSFSEKVAEVEERYAMKIQGLMLNNTDIRRNYMKKCAELLDIQTKNYSAQERRSSNAKSTMKELAKPTSQVGEVSTEVPNRLTEIVTEASGIIDYAAFKGAY